MTDPAPQESQLVWNGLGELGTDHHTRVLAWLTANDIDGNDVSAHFPITAAASEIRYTRILKNAETGRAYIDHATGVAAETTEVAPLLVPWEEATAP